MEEEVEQSKQEEGEEVEQSTQEEGEEAASHSWCWEEGAGGSLVEVPRSHRWVVAAEEEGCPVRAEVEGSCCDGVAVEQQVCEPVTGV